MRSCLIVWRKEILDTMRDSRTVFLTLALPLFLYPIIFVIIGRVEQSNEARVEQVELQVGIRGLMHAPALEEHLLALEQIRLVPVTLGPSCVDDGLVQMLIDVPEHHEALILTGAPSTIRLHYDATDGLSTRALRQVEAALAAYRLGVIRTKLAGSGLDPGVVDAPHYAPENRATASQMGALAASALVPYLLVLLIASGASHTAMDSTAGEKERCTLETVLVSAASRTQIILGKFLATFSTSVLSGIMGFLGLVIAMRIPATSWEQGFGDMRFEPVTVVILLIMVMPVAALLSAIFLALGCYARGSREAQTFSSYFIFFVIMLAVMSSMIEVELTTEILLIPIVGTTLAQRQLLTGAGEPAMALVAVASTLTVAAAALWIAVRLFAEERVMFRQ